MVQKEILENLEKKVSKVRKASWDPQDQLENVGTRATKEDWVQNFQDRSRTSLLLKVISQVHLVKKVRRD